MAELKPCPCCGFAAGLQTIREERRNHDGAILTIQERYSIFCPDCGLQTQRLFYKEDAIEIWNRREGNG